MGWGKTYPVFWEMTGCVRALPEKAQEVIDILILRVVKLRAANYNYKLEKFLLKKTGPKSNQLLLIGLVEDKGPKPKCELGRAHYYSLVNVQ